MANIYTFNREDAVRFAREQGIKARTSGNELQLLYCPYCRNRTDDKNTFAINLDTGQFKCLRATCGAKGNMITLARDFDFSLGRDVDEYYASHQKYRDLTRYPRPIVRTPAVEYMESRGISQGVAERYAITTQEKDPNIIVFPFFDEHGLMRFIKYRKADFDKTKDKNKEWCEKDCKPILFGMDQCDPAASDTLVMTEGQIDSLSCAEAGIENAVSVPTGANGFTWVPYCWDFLGKFKTLIVFGDHEKGHITLLDEMKVRFPSTVKHVREEDYLDCKDANEILRKYGPEAIRKAVANAVPVENPRIKKLSQVVRKDWSKEPHFDSGLPSLNKLIGGLYLGQLVIITGQRGLGKSTLASQFGAFGIHAGYRTFFYSGELNDWQFQAWFERQVAGSNHINTIVAKSGYTRYTVEATCEHSIATWYDDMAYIYDNQLVEGDASEEETLLETMKTAILQYDCKILFIDNLMTAMMDDSKSDLYRLQTAFVNKLRLMTRAYGVLIVLVAHPRKLGRNEAEDFANDDIAGSGNIPNLADLVFAYRKPTEKEATDGIVRKLTVSKNRINGKEADILLTFDEASKRIAETADGLQFSLGWETGDEPEVYMEVPEDMDIPF